jgi:hypothetical protein
MASLKVEQIGRSKAEWMNHSEIARRLGIGRASAKSLGRQPQAV